MPLTNQQIERARQVHALLGAVLARLDAGQISLADLASVAAGMDVSDVALSEQVAAAIAACRSSRDELVKQREAARMAVLVLQTAAQIALKIAPLLALL